MRLSTFIKDNDDDDDDGMLKGVPSPICWIREWRGRRHQPGPKRWPVLAAATCDNAQWAGVWSSTLLQEDLRKLEAFHMRCQHMILGIRWHDFVRNTEVVDRTNLPSVRDVIAVEFYLYPTVGTVLFHSVKPELTE